LGRILGGISTSLLFSVFESWMVTSHNASFDTAMLEDTFAWSTFLNGLSAIISGISAHFAVAKAGLQGPFMLAGATTMVAFLLIGQLWDENYGSPVDQKTSKQQAAPTWAILFKSFGTVQQINQTAILPK
jgi:MFS transporter, MFS domain-containing protein family, molybdate-anion transporter